MRPTTALVSAVAAVTLLGIWSPPATASHDADQHSPGAVRLANIPRSSEFRDGDPTHGENLNPGS